MWIFIIVAAVILGLAALTQLPAFKGWTGQVQVNIAARIWLRAPEYRRIKNVTVPTEEGGTVQIDHLIVSPYGIFVVETKNWKGDIYGQEREANWTVKLGEQTYRKQNPLRQNYAHTKTLSEILGLPEDRFKSVVVFVGNARFRKPMPENVRVRRGYIDYIKGHNRRILTDQEVEMALGAIAERRLARGLRTNRQHVRHLKEKHGGR